MTRSRRVGRAVAKGCAGAALLALVLPASAGAAWNQPVGGASPVNQSPTLSAFDKSLALIGGVPHVTWIEFDGMNLELRVARLDGATNSWEQPWTGVSATSGGINQSTNQSAADPSLASIAGIPHVAWREGDGMNSELRVARLNDATNSWEQPWTGVSATSGGINQSSAQHAADPSLAEVGGVPYVAWPEFDGANSELRVARLNTATNTWGQPWTGVSDSDGTINQSTTRDAINPSLAAVGGVPFVAWQESDGTNDELRVARVDDLTPTWEQPWTGASATSGGINQSTSLSAVEPSLALIGGVAHVAWQEDDGTNRELRVARLTANAWGQPWSGVSATSGGINQSTSEFATEASLAAVDGVPYIAWREEDGTNTEVRVGRLEPEFTALSATPSSTGATLVAGVRTYGIPYPIGFQFGAALEQETTTDTAAAGSDNVTITKQVGGLTPATSYQFRPFATAGVPAPRVLGTTGAFTTLTAPDATAAVFSSYRLSPPVFRAAARGASIARRRPVGTRVRYALSEPATVTFRVERAAKGRRVRGKCRRQTRRNRNRRRCVRHVTLAGSFTHQGRAGPNRFKFTGRLRGRKLRPGRYRLRARPVDAAGNASPTARGKFRIVRR
jgi:hypothetical protein